MSHRGRRATALAASVAAVVLFLIVGGPAWAADFQIGDIFVGRSGGQIDRFDHSGTFIQSLTIPGAGNATGMAFDQAGNLFATTFGTGIFEFDVHGNFVGKFADCPGGTCESVVFDRDQNLYVGNADGSRNILEYDHNGNLLHTFVAAVGPRGTDWIDLAADQHTILYSSEGGILRRIDVGTAPGTQLADFVNVPGAAFVGQRLISDGGDVAADFFGGRLLRFDSSGNIINTFVVPGENLFATNLDPNGIDVWSAGFNSCNIYEWHLSTSGAPIFSFHDTRGGICEGLALFGEVTQGGGTSVPEPPTGLLLMSALVGLAAFRRRGMHSV